MHDGDFDDYLQLRSRRLRWLRCLVFVGRSGAGKSSYIQWLRDYHPQIRRRESRGQLNVFDEISCHWQLDRVRAQANRGRLTLIASHLPVHSHWRLLMRGAVAIWDLDRPPCKLRRWLGHRDIDYSEHGLRQFCRRYGANYTDAEILTERYPGFSLDQAMHMFHRECELHCSPHRAA
jgi:hypothetical protein